MNTANIPAGSNISKNIVMNTDNEIIEPVDSIVIYEHICDKKNCKQILTLNLVGTTPAHLKGWELVKKRDLMTVGVSPGNGYFNKDRLEVILMGMANYFKKVIIIVPDLPALHTYRALGYDERHAIEKLKKHRHEIERCHRRVSEQVLLNFRKQNVEILMWGDGFAQKEYYQQAHGRATSIYGHNPKFREAILRNTERYILARLGDQNVQQLGGMKKVVEQAAHYLIEEVAFFEVSHIIFNTEPLISYYRDLELATSYVNGDYSNSKNKNIGCVTYNIIDSE
jgi:tRNA-dependent cyclodipeptide synthase